MLNNRSPINNQWILDTLIMVVVFLLTYVVLTNK
jgi:hypothetical protein